MDHLARIVTGIIHFLVSLVRDRNSRFWSLLGLATGGYVLFIIAMLVATAVHSTPGDLLAALQSREIQHSIYLSLLTCSLTALLSLVVAVPIGCGKGVHGGLAGQDSSMNVASVRPRLSAATDGR